MQAAQTFQIDQALLNVYLVFVSIANLLAQSKPMDINRGSALKHRRGVI